METKTVKIVFGLRSLMALGFMLVLFLVGWTMRSTLINVGVIVFAAFIINAGLRRPVYVISQATYKQVFLLPAYLIARLSIWISSLFGEREEARKELLDSKADISQWWRSQVKGNRIASFVNKLLAAKVGRGLAIAFTYLVVFAFLIFLGSILANEFGKQLTNLLASLPEIVESVLEFLFQNFPLLNDVAPSGTEIEISEAVREVIAFIPDLINNVQDQISGITQGTITLFGDVASMAFNLVTVIIISVYMLAEEEPVYEKLLMSFGSRTAKRLRSVLSKIEEKLGSWLNGQFLLMIIIGLITYFLLIIPSFFDPNYRLDEYALPLALLAGLLEALPNIGPFITIIVTGLVAIGTSGLGSVIYVIVAFMGLQQLEAVLIVPQVMKRAIGIDPIVSILAVITGFQVSGVIGALLSIPVVGIGQIVIVELINEYKHNKRFRL